MPSLDPLCVLATKSEETYSTTKSISICHVAELNEFEYLFTATSCRRMLARLNQWRGVAPCLSCWYKNVHELFLDALVAHALVMCVTGHALDIWRARRADGGSTNAAMVMSPEVKESKGLIAKLACLRVFFPFHNFQCGRTHHLDAAHSVVDNTLRFDSNKRGEFFARCGH